MNGLKLVFYGKENKEHLVCENASLPKVGDGQILGKVLLSTICGSDLHTFAGTRIENLPR